MNTGFMSSAQDSLLMNFILHFIGFHKTLLSFKNKPPGTAINPAL
jgi:hypothetical protein